MSFAEEQKQRAQQWAQQPVRLSSGCLQSLAQAASCAATPALQALAKELHQFAQFKSTINEAQDIQPAVDAFVSAKVRHIATRWLPQRTLPAGCALSRLRTWPQCRTHWRRRAAWTLHCACCWALLLPRTLGRCSAPS
jgi:hypothetical protein